MAHHIGAIINAFPTGAPESAPKIDSILRRYAEALTEWAEATAGRMLANVQHQDVQAWMGMSAEMSKALRNEIRGSPTGAVMQSLLQEQVTLIKSLPLEAAERVHRLTLQGIEDGTRSSEIAKEIMRSGEVTASRAKLIARTEVSRTASTLTQARAQHIGSTGYIWRTCGDSDVRSDHRVLNGKFIPWDQPPVADSRTGARAHAGCIYGCRCYPEPVIPD
ncbi:phage minor head protein [Chromobacterium violaceum]|uniref:phage head morphogenesis protein n=1 Tax=Chromobacterium violaceum TaxID=536 RepID=UPI000AB40647|nr:phage minor head protein [Chromobacterium violaceum]